MKSRVLVIASLLALTPALYAADAPAAAAPKGGPAAGGPPGGGRGFGGPPPATDTSMGLPPTIAAGTVVEKLAALPKESYTVGNPFTEGTVRMPNGDVLFVEQNSSKIMRWSVADKKLSVFMHPSGYANGMTIDKQGNLIACADERNELWSISLTKTETIPYPQPLNPAVGEKPTAEKITLPAHTVLVDGKYNGKLLGGPNDVWVMPDNSLYFTDPFYARSWWAPGRQQEQDVKTVYYLSADRKKLVRALPDFNTSDGKPGTPNGIIASPDGKTLYVASLGGPGGGETYSYDVQKDGALTNRKLVAGFGSDGMTMDNQGNLYMSASSRPGGVTVVNIASGKQIGFIPVPEAPANMCFGGVDQSTLYITARTGFYAIQTKVKGAHLVK